MKKQRTISLLLMIALFLTGTIACDSLFNTDDDSTDSLYVKFCNDKESTYTITSLEIRNRGKVDSNEDPVQDWSENYLKNGETLAPGDSIYFTLNLPSGEWAEYRIGVDNGNGSQVMLYDQENYDGLTDLPITHWGSDERTVSVTILFDQYSNVVSVKGWSDWAGIDE
ncbi:MAG: hypothetical protein H6537_02880 [Bacteroidales bacterium]|nr:hypothetical protein [Bacteroidales bacterium]HPD95741.1 hypothetical protein [Tenuifilaceae bacterium]